MCDRADRKNERTQSYLKLKANILRILNHFAMLIPSPVTVNAPAEADHEMNCLLVWRRRQFYPNSLSMPPDHRNPVFYFAHFHVHL